MCHRLDARFFEELAAMKPADVCRRALCEWDGARGCYVIAAWGGVYEAYPERAEILPADPSQAVAPHSHADHGDSDTNEHCFGPVSMESGLAIIFYLLQAQDLPIAGEWISEKDVPGGVTFFRGPHAVPAHLITERFGDDLDGFRRAGAALGGTPGDMGDASFVVRVLPRVPVTVLVWRGDEEFPAEAKFLYDRTISEHLPLDVIFGMSYELCARIGRS